MSRSYDRKILSLMTSALSSIASGSNASVNLDDVSGLYHQQYQWDSVSESALKAWKHISGVLVRRFPKRYWIDVGCGGGGLVWHLRQQGCHAWGIEGSRYALGLLPVPIMLWDLRLPIRQVPTAAVVTCFDVAEHVGNAEAIVYTCASLARDTLIFGAAPPGQDGLGHIDLRPAEDWTAMFAQHGLTYCPQETEIVKHEIAANTDHNHLWWVEKNLHVYQRTGVV